MNKLNVVVEAYPELKADGTLRELSEELNHTENRIAFARQAFNDSVLEYNNAAQQAPTNLIAGLFSFTSAAMLESTTSEAERAAPRVNLA
jgi:LemA protein